MKVVHVIASLDPAMGGPPQVAVRLAAAQMLSGATVSLISGPDGDASKRIEEMLEAAHGAQSITRLEMDHPGLWELFSGSTISPDIIEHIKRADLVHIHGVWEPILYVVGLLARRCNTPYVVTPHGMLDPWSLSQKRLKKWLALTVGYRTHLNRAAFVHCLNTTEIELMAPLKLTCSTRVVPNGVFFEELEPLPCTGEFRKSHPELGDDPYVLFLSRLHYKKGLDYLASAFCLLADRVPRLRLVVAGPDGGAKADFEKQINSCRMQDRVHTIGPIYGRKKFAAIIDASCFCLPSRQEGFSIAITEALACGCPCVVSENCHFPEIEEVGAGLVLPLDAERFADGIERLVSRPTELAMMGQAGKAMIRERYTWGVIGTLMLERYAEAIS